MKSIRRQLTWKLLLSVGLLLGMGGLAVYLCARAALHGEFDAGLRAKVQALAALTEQQGNRPKLDFADEHLPSFEERGADFFELSDADGRTVERSRSLRGAPLPCRFGTLERPLFWNLTLPDGQKCRATGLKFRPPDSDDEPQNGAVPQAILVVASDRRQMDRTLATLQVVLAGGGLLLLAATALVVPRVLRRELGPLQTLAAEAARIDAASLSARFAAEGLPRELAPIAARLNELLARLQDSFERERRFSSDVAHEFRTPVAELRSLAELAIKAPEARAADADPAMLAIALHLESILTRLLALARGECGGLPVRRENVHLATFVRDACEPFQEKAAGRGLKFRIEAPDNARTETDPVLLRSILTNLLDNAVSYTPQSGVIEVEATADNGRLTLRVVNGTEDLTERDLPHLFERFWRRDDARPTDGHTGLGLSMARAFAEAIGCQLSAALVAPGRLAMVLTQSESDD
ncbi:MAG TPA: HAMP domain-containing sensor histidine kinase [Candidatus Paceibacterota bacterium]|nr:HAMP domain-containing sensor histidine kinase [Verrucomicrobiota bacterium]HSA11712.1 HAMP domain-containing sensor histidine kinase [Candidatus Paceibacterota bacterium]